MKIQHLDEFSYLLNYSFIQKSGNEISNSESDIVIFNSPILLPIT